MRSCLVSRPVALATAALVALLTGCGTVRPLSPAEADPLEVARAPRAPLPDETERAAGEMARLVLADRPDSAVAMLQILRADESSRVADGRTKSGLIDNCEDMIYAMSGPTGYAEHARKLLERDDLDPGLRLRLENTTKLQSVRFADMRLEEDTEFRAGVMFNRVAEALSRLVIVGSVNPLLLIQTVLSSALTFHSLPKMSPRERQALHAFEEYRKRHPDAPNSERVLDEIARLSATRDEVLHDDALEKAETLLQAGHARAAELYAQRAIDIDSESEAAKELKERAEAVEERYAGHVRATLDADIEPRLRENADERNLAIVALVGPLARISEDASDANEAPPGERAFLASFGMLARGEEDEFFAELSRIRALEEGPMARHADAILLDGWRNAYGRYRSAIAADRRRQASWILLGRHADGATDRDLYRPIEYLLDLPGIAVSLLSIPIRLLQYPVAHSRFGSVVILTGERYVKRYPQGIHAQEVHHDLEERYRDRDRFSLALEHHRARDDADESSIEEYSEKLGEKMLEAAAFEARNDMRAMIYRSIMTEHPTTPAARQAAENLRALRTGATPQGIRISRAFLREHPELSGYGALGLRSELLDEDEANGELAEDGVTLIGRTFVRVSLEGREAVVRPVPAEDFARFISRLEVLSYHQLSADRRNSPSPDPARDLFFERARLGLLDQADTRSTAYSSAEFLSTQEKHGYVRTRESLLPVELMIRSDLETMGFSPVPQLRLPKPSSDEFLFE